MTVTDGVNVVGHDVGAPDVINVVFLLAFAHAPTIPVRPGNALAQVQHYRARRIHRANLLVVSDHHRRRERRAVLALLRRHALALGRGQFVAPGVDRKLLAPRPRARDRRRGVPVQLGVIRLVAVHPTDNDGIAILDVGQSDLIHVADQGHACCPEGDQLLGRRTLPLMNIQIDPRLLVPPGVLGVLQPNGDGKEIRPLGNPRDFAVAWPGSVGRIGIHAFGRRNRTGRCRDGRQQHDRYSKFHSLLLLPF